MSQAARGQLYNDFNKTRIRKSIKMSNPVGQQFHIDFNEDKNIQNFWFISKNKEEPRVANRFEEIGSELEQPLAIARDVKSLYQRIKNLKNSMTISRFLADNNDLRHAVRRVFMIEKFPYSEIQDNIIG